MSGLEVNMAQEAALMGAILCTLLWFSLGLMFTKDGRLTALAAYTCVLVAGLLGVTWWLCVPWMLLTLVMTLASHVSE